MEILSSVNTKQRSFWLLGALVFTLLTITPLAYRLLSPVAGDLAENLQRIPGGTLQYLPDPQGSLVFADVERLAREGRFRNLRSDKKGSFSTSSIVWLCGKLPNDQPHAIEVVLELDNPYLDAAFLYRSLPDGQQQLGRTGQRIAFASRSLPSHVPAFRVTLPPQTENEFFLRCEAIVGSVPEVLVWPTVDSFYRGEKLRAFIHTLYLGVCGALFFYNAFVYVILRDRALRLYLAYLASVGLLAFLGSNISSLFFDDIWGIGRLLAVLFLLTLCSFSLVRFSREFLETGTMAPRLHRALGWLLGIIALGLGATPLLYWSAVRATLIGGLYFFTLLTFAMLLLSGMYLWVKGSRRAPLFVLAFVCYGVGLGWAILSQLGWLPPDRTNGFPAVAGSILEIIFLSIAVAYRYRLILEEKNALQFSYAAQLEAEVVNRTRELSELTSTLARSNADKDQLIAVIAHDVRTPLVSLLAVNRSLPESTLSKSIHRQCGDLLDLVNNLLDWARLRTGLLPYEAQPMNLAGVIDSSLRTLLAAAAVKSIEVIVMVPAHLEVHADGHAVECILRNLVANAVKFTPAGGKITIAADKDGDWIDLRVSDTGVGISASRMPLIESITQSGTSGTDGELGAGFGLSLCRELARREGGSLAIFSVPGEGTAATVRLPSSI